jgi:hypothetical protein
MSSPSKLLIAAVLLAVSAPAGLAPAPAQADPLAFNPEQPGHHPGPLPYYYRYRILSPDWFERRDTITLQAGDAVAANKAMMMRDPWPPYVANRDIPFNGVVMDRAIDQYKAGTVPLVRLGD